MSDPTGGREFLGAGVAFPLGLDSDGRVAMRSLEDQVRQSILLILRTARGGRGMHPDFGAGLEQLVFAPLTATTVALAEHQAKEALIRFEPRIDVVDVRIETHPETPSTLLIHVDYRIRANNAFHNVVYPFYIDEGREAGATARRGAPA